MRTAFRWLAAVSLALAMMALVLSPATAGAAPPPPKLFVNGLEVKTDVPPTILQGRTLVPVRVISEGLGAWVGWHQETRTVTVTLGKREIKLKIGNREARVNGQTVTLDVPATIVRDRTLVPLRFIGEALGAAVEWNGQTRTVWVQRYRLTAARWQKEPGRGRITLALDGRVAYAVKGPGEGNGSPSLFIELPNVSPDLPQEVVPVNDGPVVEIRAASNGAQDTLVTVELNRAVEYRVTHNEAGTEIYLDLQYRVEGVAYDKTRGAVVISTTGPVQYEILELGHPDRLVIDIKDSRLAPEVTPRLEVGEKLVRRVRVSQFQQDPDVVRVVVDLGRRTGYNLDIRERELAVYFKPRLEQLAWEKQAGSTRVRLVSDGEVDYKVEYAGPYRVAVDIPSATSDLPGDTYQVGDGVIERILVKRDAEQDGLRVILELPYYLGHRVLTGAATGELVLEVDASPLYRRKVAVDPGHGGADPGARSDRGTLEKDINLDVALVLKQLLLDAGAVPLLTRETDIEVPLYDRPALANGQKADLFVSIHSNSFTDSTKFGTETYYYVTNAESKRLAEAIHREVVAELGTADRGVRMANFVVLRESTMPSALLELAFLSHPGDESLLRNPLTRRRAAQAILKGLLNFYGEKGI